MNISTILCSVICPSVNTTKAPKKGFSGHPRPLFRLFLVSYNKHYNFYNVTFLKKIPFSIQCWDSNPRLSEQKSPLLTTRPGLNVMQDCSDKLNKIKYNA